MRKGFRFAPLSFAVLALVLTACPSTGGGGSTGSAPQITSFTANPKSITAPGQAVALSWTVTNGVTRLEIDQGVGAVSGTSQVVYPTAATTYTLTAANSSGETSESVSVGLGTGPAPGPGVEDGSPPFGTFGVSLTQGDFQSDQSGSIADASDPRIIRVQPGGTFYALVSYEDSGGLAGATIYIANRSPPGLRADLVQGQDVGGFTLNGEVSGCVLDGTQTSVTCIYEIAVGDISNITELPGVSGEFAYVFRTRVTDAAGTVSDTPPRGYVIVGSGGTPTPPGTPNPPGNPDPPGNPNPPANRAPNADFTFNQQNGTLTVAFSGARSSDPDGDSLKYAWTFGDGTTATSRDFRKIYGAADDYTVSLKVTDPDGATNTETKPVTVEPVDGGGGGTPTSYTLKVTEPENGTVTSDLGDIDCGSICSEEYDEGEEITLTANADDGYKFDGWNGDCSGTTCTVTMDNDKNVTAAFSVESEMPQFSVKIADVKDVTIGADGKATVQLDGTVSNAPVGTTYKWTAEGENAGKVTFDPAASEDTEATFTEAETYTLRLTATNGTQSPYATVNVTVKAASGAESLKVLSATYATNYRTQDNTSVICDNRTTTLTYRFTYEGELESWQSYLQGQTSKEVKGERTFKPDSGGVVTVGEKGFEVTYEIDARAAPYSQSIVVSPEAINIIVQVPQPTPIGAAKLYLVLSGTDGKAQPFFSNDIPVISNCP